MLTIIEAVLRLAVTLAELYSQRKTFDAAKALVLREMMINANVRVAAAIAARRAVTDSVPDNDPYRRD